MLFMFTLESPNVAPNRHRSLSHTIHNLTAITKCKCNLLKSDTGQLKATGTRGCMSATYFDEEFWTHEESAVLRYTQGRGEREDWNR